MIVDQFSEIFAGNANGYGLYNGKGHTFVKQPVTKKLYQQHLEGKISLGIVPITNKGNCRFGVIDFDDHKKNGIKIKDFDYASLLKKIKFLKLPLVVFKSKSGGAHAYLFLQEWTPAKDRKSVV